MNVLKSLVPMEAQGQKAITIVALVLTVFIVLSAFGLIPETLNRPLPQFR
jgi:hypothetical protein